MAIKRILMVGGDSLINRGVEQYILNLVRHMDHSRFTVDVLTPYSCEEPKFRNSIEEYGGRVLEMKCREGSQMAFFQFISRLRAVVHQVHYDVVEVQTGALKMLAAAATAVKGNTDLLILHTHNTHEQNFKHKLGRVIFCPLMNGADRYFACSKNAGIDSFPKHVHGKIEVIPNAIDIDRFQFDAAAAAKIRTDLGLTESFVVGHIGAFTQQKNHRFLLDVFTQLVKDETEENRGKYRLLLVGEGELEPEIRQLAQDRGLSSRVIFYGTTSQVPALLSAMDIFVFPSAWEGLGIAVVEAQANGLPCFCSSELPPEVAVTAGYHSLELKDGPQLWAEQIEHGSQNGRNEQQADKACKQVMKSCFAVKQWVENLEIIYGGVKT